MSDPAPMKKVLRLFLIGVTVVAALLLLAVGLAFTSGFQTWVTRRALAAQPELRASVGRVEAGPGHVRLEQLRLVQAGATLTLPAVEIDLPLVAAAREDFQIKRLVAKGWTIDLTQPAAKSAMLAPTRSAEFSLLSAAYGAEAAPVAAATVFQGVFSQLKLPVDLRIDDVDLEGEVVIQVVEGQAPVRVQVVITGGQLGAGREGKFAFTASAALAANAPVNALTASGTITAAMDTPRTFSRLSAQIDATARGSQFPEGAKLALGLTAARANAGENYTVAIESAGRKLLGLQAAYPAPAGPPLGVRELTGSWMLDLGDTDVAPFVLGRALPAFAAKGDGKFDADATWSGISASGHLDANADRLGAVRGELAALGAVKIATDFDLVLSGRSVRVTGFTAEIAGIAPVLTVRALQPFEFNAETSELKVGEPAKDLLSLDLQGVPVAWVQPFAKAMTISGDNLRGSFVVGARGGGFAVRPVGPLTLNNLNVAQGGRPWLRMIDLSLQASADYTPQGWQAELANLSVRSGAIVLLNAGVRAGQLAGKDQPVKIAGQWTANLPAVLLQPVVAGYAGLTAGKAAGDFAASLGAKRELQFKFALTGLAADPRLVATTLPSLSADVRADVDKDGRIVFNAPLLIERDGRKSDLTLAGNVVTQGAGLIVDAHLTSSFLAVEDGQILAAPFAGGPEVPVRGPAVAAAPDRAAAWSGVTGQLTLALKKVTYQQKFEMSELGGTIRIETALLKLDGLHAGLAEDSNFKLGGAVTFDAAAKEPYAMKGDFSLQNFNSVPLFQAFDPGKPATIEGKFNVAGQFAGSGINLAQLAARTRGDFQLNSKGGTCRLLQADVSDKLQKTQTTVATIGGLLGAMTGREKIADYANRTQIVVEVADDWKEIPFDQLNVAIRRDSDLNILLQDFTLISPTKRIVGTGQIRYAEGTPLLGQSLDLRLQLGARGKTADLMNRASLLNGQTDNLGYVGFLAPIHLGGTLENPDTTEFRTALLKAAGNSLLNNLLGR